MDNTHDFRLLLASRHPLIVAEMSEEARFMAVLQRAADALSLPVWTWSLTRGLARVGHGPQYGTVEPKAALAFVEDVPGPGVYVLTDAHHAFADPVVLRRIKEFAQEAEPGKTLVLAVPDARVPPELRGLALYWTLQPPSREELSDLVSRTVEDLRTRGFPVTLDEAGLSSLVEAVRGLSAIEAEGLIQQAALRDGVLAAEDVEFVRGAKAELLEAGGALELVEVHTGSLEDVGGMPKLKEWLAVRGRAREPQAAAFGLEPPRGVLLTGVPGCGKSMAAKGLARSWRLPLVLLDPSRLFGPYVGESEQRLADSLRTVDAMAPVVLWVDEIEKGFSSRGEADGGVARRILGTFLRWMQDRPPGVFVVATSNDVTSLPPEFARKGRFDEVFFVDLPAAPQREEIFRLHLSRRDRDPEAFDLRGLVAATDGFSGAEIEAAVVGALYRAYAAGTELATERILEEVRAMVPLSRARAEEIGRLRAWAQTHAVPA
jgi:ATP-dependent 26S proteasome regulatory subunit